jgi:hypothetical protein
MGQKTYFAFYKDPAYPAIHKQIPIIALFLVI